MFAVLVPVGPSPRELSRLDEVVHGLRAVESDDDILLFLVDDAPRPRDLLHRVSWPSGMVVRTALWSGRAPDAYSAMVAGTLDGLRVAASYQPEFVLKLDTDALTIGPFSETIRNAFERDPGLGVVGSFDRTCTGGPRDWSVWKAHLERISRPVVRLPTSGRRPRVGWRSTRDRRAACRLLGLAYEHGYVTGAHCLGGAYAVSPAFLRHTELFDPRPWVKTGLGEDVVIGVLCHVAGLRMQGMVGPGEPFGLAHVGLPGSPEWLAERGHSIVHAVKDDSEETERRIRAALRDAAGRAA